MFKKLLTLMAVVLVFSASQVQADLIDLDWVGGEGGAWDQASNWNPATVPDNSEDTFVVTIDSNDMNWVAVGLQQNRTIDQLDCYGNVELGTWTPNWVVLTLEDANGLTNYGEMEIWSSGQGMMISGDITNIAGAWLELSGVEIDGDLDNQAGATLEIWETAEIEGELQNDGDIIIDPISELWIDDNLFNDGEIMINGGVFGSDETIDNNTTGVIKGFGIVVAEALINNKGTITAHGGSLVVYTEGGLLNTGTLSNNPVSSLQISPGDDINNTGTIIVMSDGGITIDANLTNMSTGAISLVGGTLAARSITQSSGATFAGFGTIATNNGLTIQSGATITLSGPTNIIGNLIIASGGTLTITAGQTFVTGTITNNGTILQAGGTISNASGLSGYGETVDAIPSLSSLIGHWQMDDNTINTVVNDSSDYDNDGTAQQNTSTINTTGMVGDALAFNGSSDYITIGGLTSLNDFTYAMWVKFDTLSGKQKILDGGKFYMRLVVDGGGTHIDVYSSGLSDSYMRAFSFTPVTGQWYHLVYTYDGTTKKLYVDGSLELQESATGTMDAFTSMNIGANNAATGDFFNGSMDNLSIFNEALAQADIEEMYEEVAFVAGYWTLDDNAGNTTVSDSSYKGNDGTAQQNTSSITTSGAVDEALTFNGSSDYIAITDLTTSFNDFTYAVWVKFDTVSVKQKILDGGKFYIRLVVDGGGTHIDVYSSGLSDSYMRAFSFTPVTGQWYHLAYTYDGSSKKLYVDGSLELQESATGTADAFTSMNIGTNSGATSRFFDGSMDNLVIFNDALTDAQIQELYNE